MRPIARPVPLGKQLDAPRAAQPRVVASHGHRILRNAALPVREGVPVIRGTVPTHDLVGEREPDVSLFVVHHGSLYARLLGESIRLIAPDAVLELIGSPADGGDPGVVVAINRYEYHTVQLFVRVM